MALARNSADRLTDYAEKLPKELFNIEKELVNAIDLMELKNPELLGQVYDKLQNAKTILQLLEHSMPVGFRYLDSLLDIKEGI